MPSMTKREVGKIIKRLEQIYEKLDGTPKKQALNSKDEFSNLQIAIGEEFVSLRDKIK